MEQFKGYSASQIIGCIDEWLIGRNAERDRNIMKRKIIDGRSDFAVAEEFKLSEKRVNTISRKCKKIILEHIDEYVKSHK